MGRQKADIGRRKKNYERREQARSGRKVGRPPQKEKETFRDVINQIRLPSAKWAKTEDPELKRAMITKIGESHSVPVGININDDLSWMASAFGHLLQKECHVLASSQGTVEKSAEYHLLQAEKTEFCAGLDEEFVSFVKSKKGKLLSTNGKDVTATLDATAPGADGKFRETVRSKSCDIVTKVVQRCCHCIKHRYTQPSVGLREKKRPFPFRLHLHVI